jgi:hypothetical protein
MANKLTKKKTFSLSFLLGCLITWLSKNGITNLLFSGMAFSGRSIIVKTGLLFVYTTFFTFIILCIFMILAKPTSKIGNILNKQLNDDKTFIFGLDKTIFLFFFAAFFIIGNLEIVPRNIPGFPQNGQLQNNDLPSLIKNANSSETVNFSFGDYSRPQSMIVIISPDIINQLNIDFTKIHDTYKPFRDIEISSLYPALLNQEQLIRLTKESRYITWHQFNGNSYYYFLPLQEPETYYVTTNGSDIIFLPEQIYNEIFMRIN